LIKPSIEQWNNRYLSGAQVLKSPAPLVVEFAGALTPGCALDLASGPGRHALYLAERGWRVTALDGSTAAIDLLAARAGKRVDARVVDLEATDVDFPAGAYDLVLSTLYLQRSLIPLMKSALRPGGLLIMIVLVLDQPPGTSTRAYHGELRAFFQHWPILHYREGEVAELVARKPA